SPASTGRSGSSTARCSTHFGSSSGGSGRSGGGRAPRGRWLRTRTARALRDLVSSIRPCPRGPRPPPLRPLRPSISRQQRFFISHETSHVSPSGRTLWREGGRSMEPFLPGESVTLNDTDHCVGHIVDIDQAAGTVE